MVTYDGECRGGPYDGKRLRYYSKRYNVELREPIPLVPDLDKPVTSPTIRYGTYVFILGQWVWRDPYAPHPRQG